MTPRVGNIVIDCADLDAMAAFWGGLLGMRTSAVNADWLDLEPLGTGGPVLSFQRVPEGKKAKNRLHLDLDVPDVRAAGERAVRLGATPAAGLMGDPASPFQVWRDPEGNEFCFCTAS
ncbi:MULTISPECIES: VOC family protein [Actinomadura]|uniref:Glyoxalase-like domain-containing protein n=1 Tax=Actinomadura madurae TaxID=1993 RepID=A0A1I4WEA5_9ACTN|nr:VOC family protein [Actinomadura madurae]SFN11968.1 Glyoxalase-like domain-containing protein [Actinomadura madurae]SPT63173.1 Predicted enzyme related to lactoylglutathione lyase [Actinomadura madurae]